MNFETIWTIAQVTAFVLLFGTAVYLITQRINFIKRSVKLGKPTPITDAKGERLKQMLLLAFGQKKMFDRPIVGLLHLLIYVGFILINIEVLEIILDGLTGAHRLFAPALGSFYTSLINFFEILAALVVFSCIVFLIRRNILHVPRLSMAELKGWPKKDANIILVWEIILMGALYTMNAADSVLQTRVAESAFVQAHYPEVGTFIISGKLVPLFTGLSTSALLVLERTMWWLHIAGILAFAVYVTYSKHLHIFLAFPNTYFSKVKPLGEMANMDQVTKEVRIMLGLETEANTAETPTEPETFGAKDVTDLSWKNLMDAYTCTHCGRCTANCPANITGKKLSPRKIMMDTRFRAEELQKHRDQSKSTEPDGKSLYGDYITKEELNACTTCNACVESCPVGINPLDIILQQRRYIAMEESGTPAAWNAMFGNVENNGAPWAFNQSDRFKWAQEVEDTKTN